MQRGFSLVELMLVLVLGSGLLAAAYYLFSSHMQQVVFHQTQHALMHHTDTAQHVISQAWQSAGEAGCRAIAPDFQVTQHVPYLSWLGITNGRAIMTYYSADQGFTPSLPAQLVGKPRPGSDVLLIEKASYQRAHLATPMADTAAPIETAQPDLFAAGDIVLIADCQRADLFAVMSTGAQQAGQVLHHTGLSHAYGVQAQVMHWHAQAFYVAQSSRVDAMGQPIWALYQDSLLPEKPRVELVSHIQQLAIELATCIQGQPTWLRPHQIPPHVQIKGLVSHVLAYQHSHQEAYPYYWLDQWHAPQPETVYFASHWHSVYYNSY